MPLSVIALAVGMFAIGTTEFVIVGLLPTLATALGASVSTIGFLVTAYALGIAVGGPIVMAATGRIPRKKLLVLLMLLFVFGNLLCGLAPTFQILLAARLLTSLTHAVFVGAGVVVAMDLVDDRHRGRAVATVFGGLTIALVIGVPLGTFLGQEYTWRVPFFVVAGLGVLAAIGNQVFLPQVELRAAIPWRRQLTFLTDRRLLVALAVSALAFGGNILAYTYVAPFLEQVTGFAAPDISWLLFAFGLAAAVGNFTAGPLSDKWPGRSLTVGLTALAAVLLLMTVTGQTHVGAVITLILWGGIGIGIAPILQTNSTISAPAIPEIASSLTVSAFNLGIAGGAYIGGHVVTALGVHAVTWVGSILAAAAIPLACLGVRAQPAQGGPRHGRPADAGPRRPSKRRAPLPHRAARRGRHHASTPRSARRTDPPTIT